MRLLPSTLLLSSLVLLSGLSHAQDAQPPADATKSEQSQKDLARDLYQEGSRLYDQADYAGAVAAFEKAYAAYPAAALLFNLAQAHRLLGPSHCEQALDYYERYKVAPESAGDRREVEVRIAEMRGCVKAAQAAAQDRATQPAAPPPTPESVPPQKPIEPAPKTDRPIPTAAYVLGGVAVVGLATFGTLAILGRNQQSQLERSCSPKCSPEQVQPMKTKFLIADIGLAVFAVSLGGAGYLVLSRPTSSSGSNSALDGAQLKLMGSF
jgi:tetratricopeptide (TPR) repeat protein